MADLITLEELRTALGIDPTDTRRDDQYGQAITFASLAIRNYTGRDFGTGAVDEERTFEYDNSGYLDIDDAQTITTVKMTTYGFPDSLLDASQWVAMPQKRDDSPVYWYMILPGGYAYGSPEMGFTRNLDVVYAEGRFPTLPRLVKVTGTWGWPDVPDDVKQAAIWTVQEWTSKATPNGGEQLTAEAIEGFSRSWGGRSGAAAQQALAIPNRARDLLIQYVKPMV